MKIFIASQYQKGKSLFLNLKGSVHKLVESTESKLKLSLDSALMESCRLCGKT